jgi:two-component system, NtrC family, sensor histidine kinase HydH
MTSPALSQDPSPALPLGKLRRSVQQLGPVVIAFLLGVFLVGSSAQSYRDARLAARMLAERQGISWLFRLRSAIVEPVPDSPTLARALAANRAQGLTYIGVIERGTIVSTAGEALLSDTEPEVGAPAFGRKRVRMVSPGFGRDDAAAARGGIANVRPGKVEARRRPRRSTAPSSETFPLDPFNPPTAMRYDLPNFPQFIVEFIPVGDEDIIRRAKLVLILSCGAALFLAAAAAILWVAARRAELAGRKLLAQGHLARLGELSAVLAHEIRNPLAALKGHAQLLAERLRDTPHEPRIERVVNEAVRLENLTNSLLQFATSGTIRVGPASPGELLERAIAATDPDRIEVRKGRAPAVWVLDDARVEQVLVNLLDNALAVTPAAEKVSVEISVVADGLVYDIRDHGPGVPVAQRARIFDAFHTTKMRGTGLGLSMSKRIVDLHRGRIEVEDAAGGGALFRVVLPAHTADTAHPASSAHTAYTHGPRVVP